MQSDTQSQVNTIIGYGLIGLGVVIMFLSCLQVYRIFTKQSQPIAFFQFEGIKIDLQSLAPQIDTSALDQVRRSLNLPPQSIGTPASDENMTELIPAEVLNGPANLGVSLLFMSFILNLGYKLADLGIKLARTIQVKMG